MGKYQQKAPKIQKKIKSIGLIAHKKNSNFDLDKPIGLARIFNLQKK